MWIYKAKGDTTFDVGYYSPNGIWVAVHNYASESDAQAQVSFLNGGTAP